MAKILISVVNDIIVNARLIDPTNESGNDFRNIKNRYHGEKFEIETNEIPESFLYKKFKNGKVSNSNFDDNSRQFKINCRKALEPLDVDNPEEYQDIPYELISGYFTREVFDRNRKALIDGTEIEDVSSEINSMPTELKTRLIYLMAKYFTRTNPFTAITWWNRLTTTDLRRVAISHISVIYYNLGDEDRAIDTYEQLSGDSEALERAGFMGRGKDPYNLSVAALENENYEECLKQIVRFDSIASGLTRMNLYKKIRIIKGKCLVGMAKNSTTEEERLRLTEDAKKAFYPERYGIKHECDHIRW